MVMKIKKFKFFSPVDYYDLKFQHEICWSRIYEYPFVLNEIKEHSIKDTKIHNASWGFRDIHLVFKTHLDMLYNNVTHSDIKPSTLYNTEYWNITEPSSYSNQFDIIINVSTVEEVEFDHVEIIKNHLNQLKDGGIFILTFDYPGLQLDYIEDFLQQKISEPDIRLTPRNSVLPDHVLNLPDNFTVGYLVIEK